MPALFVGLPSLAISRLESAILLVAKTASFIYPMYPCHINLRGMRIRVMMMMAIWWFWWPINSNIATMFMLAFFTRCGISYILGQIMEMFTYHWHIAWLLPLLSETLYLSMAPLENILLSFLSCIQSQNLISICVRDRWRYQNGWIFWKFERPLTPPPFLETYISVFFHQRSLFEALYKGPKSTI